jgi:hypothetical protein
MGLLPKPEKKVGARGRGVYGFYDPDIVLLAVKFILDLKESGASLEKIKEESERLVISQYMNRLKDWGFSDYSLPEMGGTRMGRADKVIRMLTGQIFLKTPNSPGMDTAERMHARDRELVTQKRTAFESELIGKARWWEAKKIERLALENISKEAMDIYRGMGMTDHIIMDEKENEEDQIDPWSIKKLRLRTFRKRNKIVALICNLNARLAEINGGQWNNRSAESWRAFGRRIGQL